MALQESVLNRAHDFIMLNTVISLQGKNENPRGLNHERRGGNLFLTPYN